MAKSIVYQHSVAPEEVPLVPCIGGVLLDGVFVPLDFDSIDAEVEADVAAGRTYPLDEVITKMGGLIAGWVRQSHDR